MSKTIKFTNTSDEAFLFLDVDKGDRENTYSKWTLNPEEERGIGEDEIQPTTDFSLISGLKSGMLSIDLEELDELESMEKKNFIGSGVGVVYKNSSGNLDKAHIVALDTEENEVGFVSTAGDMPYGVLMADGSTGLPVRIKYEGYADVPVHGAVTSGDKLVSNTSGKAIASSTPGLWQIGEATSDATTGDIITIQIDIKQIQLD